MKKLLILLFSFFLLGSPSVLADSNYKTINLPKGVSIDVPINWQVMSNNQRITLDAYVETLYEPLDSDDFPFAANYFNEYGKVDALLNIRYYPWIEINQKDVINATSDEVLYLDSVLHENISLSMKSVDGNILSWKGTKKKYINGAMTLITEYRRYSGISGTDARVRLVRVIDGNKSFTLTVSYNDTLKSSFMLEGITNRIIESLSLSN